MPDDIFSLFPNWDDPSYRRYWLKHNLNSELWQDYSGADLYRALASEGRYVSENMLYEVRSYMLSHDDRVQQFGALNSDETIPIGMHETEPYWTMTSNYLYTMAFEARDEEGNVSIITRALGSNEQLTPNQLRDTAARVFSKYPELAEADFDTMAITHAYRR